MAKRKTEKNYHDLAKSRGFRWVGEVLPEYTCVKTLWECAKGHRWEARYHDICHNDSGCPKCLKKVEKDYLVLAKSRKFKWVGEVFPKNTHTKTLWECKKGHKWKAHYNSIQQGNGCPYCYGIARKIEKDYHVLAESREFLWVGTVLPKNTFIKTTWQCTKGHKWKARYNDISGGSCCPFCSVTAKKMEDSYYKLAKCRGFVWAGVIVPKNTLSKTWWTCEKKHRWEATYGNIFAGSSCPYCDDRVNGSKVSKPQRKINDLLCGSLNYPEGKYRIDIAIMRKSQKIVVEYDAQYWHTGREKKDFKRDKYLINKGWKILHIKSGSLLPKRKQLSIAIDYLLETNGVLSHNLYLEDWKV